MSEPTKTPTDSQCYVRDDSQLIEIARAHGMSSAAADALARIDSVMHQIRRSMIRRDFGRQVLERLAVDVDVAHMDVIGAIGQEGPEPDGQVVEEVTVGLVAERLAIDPSRASRLVAEIVDRGYAGRVASQGDARRICLELTAQGQTFIRAVRETKWHVFSKALHNWQEDELVVFSRLLERFSTWTRDSAALDETVAAISQAMADGNQQPAAPPREPVAAK